MACASFDEPTRAGFEVVEGEFLEGVKGVVQFEWVGGDEGFREIKVVSEIEVVREIKVAENLVQNNTLTELDLGDNSIHDEGAKVIANAPLQNHTFTELDLGDNHINDGGAKAIANALLQKKAEKVPAPVALFKKAKRKADLMLQNTVLTELGTKAIANAPADEGGGKAIANTLLQEGKKRVAGNKRENIIPSHGKKSIIVMREAKALAGLISQGAEIERITIKGVARLGLEPLFHLCEAIGKELTKLRLCCSSDCLTMNNVKRITDLMLQNAALTELDLGFNYIHNDRAKAIANVLLQNRAEGGKAIANSVLQNHTLTELNLRYNGIHKEGAKAIANALLQNRSLTRQRQ